MINQDIAIMFDTMADIMEIRGKNPFRINSYRKVATILRDMPEDIGDFAGSHPIEKIPGIGKSSAAKIREYLETGQMSDYQKRLKSVPPGALKLLEIPDVGPKTIARLIDEKGITDMTSLEEAIEKGRLEGMPGIGAKTIQKMKKGIAFVKSYKGRILLGEAMPAAKEIIAALKEHAGLKQLEVAGSLRRGRETIGDVDILAAETDTNEPTNESLPCSRSDQPDHEKARRGRHIIKTFTRLPMCAETLAEGDTKGSIRTKSGMQVDLRVVPKESFGAALQYFTGSKEHNVKLRSLAAERGLKINEYGVFRGEEKIAGKDEESIYASLDLPFIPPQLREDRGEVEAAGADELPKLIEQEHIKGDLHAHCTFSDGAMTVEEMAHAAAKIGYRYVAITDHSKNLTVAGGIDEDELKERNELIDRVNAETDGFSVLKGTEVDILKDGSLDYADSVLEELDWVIASIHDHFNMSESRMTERIIYAIRNPHVDCIGHLTGRLLNRREPYPVTVHEIIEACSEHNTALELNAHPERLDINDITCREAKKAGIMVAIGTDAHTAAQYGLMRFGITTARRGWLGPGDILNAKPCGFFLQGHDA